MQNDQWSDTSTFICQTCMFFVPKSVMGIDAETGRCRKHAPVVQLGWPTVYPTDWCGDHKLRTVADAKGQPVVTPVDMPLLGSTPAIPPKQ